MSGHNKWSKIKHQKAKTDATKNRVFSRASLAIIAAVKEGGSDDPDLNASLRMAIEEAKKVNMPKDNIKRAIERGTGKGGAGQIEECTYEGYAPGGVALYIECMTDNRNRTAGDVRSTLDKNGGNLGEPGSVAYMFNKKGYLEFDAEKASEDQLMEILIDAGAEDIVNNGDGTISVTCPYQQLNECIKAAEAAQIAIEKAEPAMIPETKIEITEPATAKKIIDLIDKIEDLADVKDVNANFDISDAVMAQISE